MALFGSFGALHYAEANKIVRDEVAVMLSYPFCEFLC